MEARDGAKRPQNQPAQRQRARAQSGPQEGPNPAAPTHPPP